MKSKDTIRSIFRSRWVSGISDSISTKIIAICLLWCPIMLHPSYNYCTTERICAPLCQQVPYCTLSRLYIWNGALYNKREVLRHAAQAACPSEKQMLDSVLNGNTVFFARTSPKHTRPREGRESSCRRMPTVWMGAARTAGAFSNLDVFGSRRGGSGILPTHACE